MKHSWTAVVFLAAACSTPPSRTEILLRPSGIEPGAFAVSDIQGEPETRRYRVKPEELLADASDYRFHYNDGYGASGPTGAPADDPATALLGQTVRVIREFVAPSSWDQDGRRAIYVEKDEIVARHVPAVLDQVERFIATLKKHRSAVLSVQAQFAWVRRGELAAIEHLDHVDGGLAGVVESKAIWQASFIRSASRIQQAPRLSLFHGQQASVRIGKNYAYIPGYKREGPLFDPQPDVTWTGLDVRVRGVANGPDSDRWLIRISAEQRELQPPPPRVTSVQLGNRLYEMPVTIGAELRVAFTLGPDQTLLLLPRQAPTPDDRMLLVFVTAYRVE